jgi:periplasmic copper chaperone A
MRRIMAIMVSIVALLALGACATAPTTTSAPAPAAPAVSLGTLTVSDPWIRPASAGEAMGAMNSDENQEGHGEEMGAMVTTGGYMTLSNSGAEADFLLAAAADELAEAIELHTMEMDGEVMRMRQVERIEIPAGGVTELRPGGLHIMFIGLKRSLEPGETVKLRLSFERGGSVEVEAVVRNP